MISSSQHSSVEDQDTLAKKHPFGMGGAWCMPLPQTPGGLLLYTCRPVKISQFLHQPLSVDLEFRGAIGRDEALVEANLPIFFPDISLSEEIKIPKFMLGVLKL